MANKRTTIMILTAVFMGSLAAWQFQSNVDAAAPAAAEAAKNPTIQDELILKGFEYLSSLKDPIQVEGGMVVSGESLAQFLVKNRIPVVWDGEGLCGGSSCSRMFCDQNGSCSYEDGQPGIDPIYLTLAIQEQRVGQMKRLAGELGHEIYHRMRPFGNVKITQVEEYWAFFVNARLTNSSFPKFENVKPQDAGQLEHWFTSNGLSGYLKLDAYPAGYQARSAGGAAQAPAAKEISTSQALQPELAR